MLLPDVVGSATVAFVTWPPVDPLSPRKPALVNSCPPVKECSPSRRWRRYFRASKILTGTIDATPRLPVAWPKTFSIRTRCFLGYCKLLGPAIEQKNEYLNAHDCG